jgi:hypothetical protein
MELPIDSKIVDPAAVLIDSKIEGSVAHVLRGTLRDVLSGVSVNVNTTVESPTAPENNAVLKRTLRELDTLEAGVLTSVATSQARDTEHAERARKSHLLPGTELSLPSAHAYSVARDGGDETSFAPDAQAARKFY